MVCNVVHSCSNKIPTLTCVRIVILSKILLIKLQLGVEGEMDNAHYRGVS